MHNKLEITAPYGKIFLEVFPKENHRLKICEILTPVLGVNLTLNSILQTKEEKRPHFNIPHFDANWSHSGDFCVLAYSFDCRVGVDIEKMQKRNFDVAKRFFAKEEIDFLNAINDEELKREKFFELWCKKEAFFKCVGGTFFEGALRAPLLGDFYNGVYLQKIKTRDLNLPPEFMLCLATKI